MNERGNHHAALALRLVSNVGWQHVVGNVLDSSHPREELGNFVSRLVEADLASEPHNCTSGPPCDTRGLMDVIQSATIITMTKIRTKMSLTDNDRHNLHVPIRKTPQ